MDARETIIYFIRQIVSESVQKTGYEITGESAKARFHEERRDDHWKDVLQQVDSLLVLNSMTVREFKDDLDKQAHAIDRAMSETQQSIPKGRVRFYKLIDEYNSLLAKRDSLHNLRVALNTWIERISKEKAEEDK